MLLAYCNTEHDSTGCTPNLLFFSCECTVPVDLTFDGPMGATDAPCPQQYVEWLRVMGQKTDAFVKQKLLASSAHQKHGYDRRASPREFKDNDLVYSEYSSQARRHKFSYPWVGPYRVVRCVGKVNYEIRPTRRGMGGGGL